MLQRSILRPSLSSSSPRKSFWTTNILEEMAHDQLAIRKTGLENLRNVRKLIKRKKLQF
jgi:hypothetical protein